MISLSLHFDLITNPGSRIPVNFAPRACFSTDGFCSNRSSLGRSPPSRLSRCENIQRAFPGGSARCPHPKTLTDAEFSASETALLPAALRGVILSHLIEITTRRKRPTGVRFQAVTNGREAAISSRRRSGAQRGALENNFGQRFS